MQASAALRRFLVLGLLAHASSVAAQSEPLHVAIDKLLTPVTGVPPATASDAEFLRRASLDLNGMPPTADEARAFLTDVAPEKRAQLIDRLFASPHFVRRLAEALDIMLMERRPNTNVTADEWQTWLLKSVRENKPWNKLAKEILTADGADPASRAPARFALDRGSDPNMLTRDIGRIFFGRDMQCAQCHDHPLVSDYLQSDYQGLYAFLQPTYTITKKEGEKQIVSEAEHAGGNVSFQSVFLHVPRRTAARVPDGTMIDEPFYLPGEEYQVAPGDNVKSIPKFSYREKLAELATNGSNEAFNRNIANRLWAFMFGRGLVQPVDWQNPENPASNPELLELLAKQVAALNFDMRAFLRELALTAAYQRSFDPPAEISTLAEKAAAEATRLQTEREALAKTTEESNGAYTKAAEAWENAEENTLPVAGELDKAKTQYADAKKKADDAAKAAADATSQLQAKKTVMAPIQQAASAAQEAVKALPADKELADAAQKFVARAKQLVAETVALTKAADEKTAAVAPTTEAWNKTKPPVEAALQKVTPLTTTLKDAEKAMLAAREKAESDKERLAALERRLSTAKKVAQVPELNQAIAAAKQLIPTREAEIAAAQKSLAEFAPLAAAEEATSKGQGDAAAAAAKVEEAARAEHTKHSAAVDGIAAAVKAMEAARQKAPDSAILTDAIAKMQDSVTRAQAEANESQKKVDAAVAVHKTADQAFVASQEKLAGTLAERARREKAIAAANEALAAAKADLAAKQAALVTTTSELNERWANDFTIAALKPLSPEQMCWSVFRVTGVYDRYWMKEVAEVDKAKPLTDEQKKDSAQVAARDIATADQALFVANAAAINSWVAPAAGNVTENIAKQNDPAVAAEQLYLTVLTRMPTDSERADVANYLKDRAKDKAVAAQELVWALLNSAEFRFNH
jgi:predicted  nucleic acid-binding Zn-ribbon protein